LNQLRRLLTWPGSEAIFRAHLDVHQVLSFLRAGSRFAWAHGAMTPNLKGGFYR
jgi:hypothetical protein